MAGGSWSTTDIPVLPGLYMNFKAAAIAAISNGSRGTVAIPVRANWGPVGAFVEITGVDGIKDAFGYTYDSNGATAYTSLYLALLGQPTKLLAYRLASSAAAVATSTLVDTATTPASVLRLDAKYKGARGNDFKVTVQTNAADSSKKDINLYEGTTLLYTFTFTSGTIAAAVSAINNDNSNTWITATKLAEGTGIIANVTSKVFASGDSGISGVVASDYSNFLTALETRTFNVLSLDGVTDNAIQTLAASWVKRVRDEGMGVIGVMGGSAADDTASNAVALAVARSTGYNHEGIVNVGTGVTLSGASYNSAQTACFVAGQIAGKALNESSTYAETPFDDVTRRWTKSEQEAAINGGVFILVNNNGLVRPLKGINSLVTLGATQNKQWKKIRTIRVMDAINSDLQSTAETSYIGKINNNEEGRASLIGAFKEYMETLALDGVIETTDWNVILDPNYYGPTKTKDPDNDQVFVKWIAVITDSVEQIFGTFTVN